MPTVLRWILFSLVFLGCATGPSIPDAPLTGEIKCPFSGASFNSTRVVGPKINASMRPDGSWGGTIEDDALDLTYKDGAFRGYPGVTLMVSRKDGTTIVSGQVRNRIVRFQVSPSELMVRTDTRSIDFPRKGPGVFGMDGEVNLTGDAATAPPTPSFALALVAAFL